MGIGRQGDPRVMLLDEATSALDTQSFLGKKPWTPLELSGKPWNLLGFYGFWGNVIGFLLILGECHRIFMGIYGTCYGILWVFAWDFGVALADCSYIVQNSGSSH